MARAYPPSPGASAAWRLSNRLPRVAGGRPGARPTTWPRTFPPTTSPRSSATGTAPSSSTCPTTAIPTGSCPCRGPAGSAGCGRPGCRWPSCRTRAAWPGASPRRTRSRPSTPVSSSCWGRSTRWSGAPTGPTTGAAAASPGPGWSWPPPAGSACDRPVRGGRRHRRRRRGGGRRRGRGVLVPSEVTRPEEVAAAPASPPTSAEGPAGPTRRRCRPPPSRPATAATGAVLVSPARQRRRRAAGRAGRPGLRGSGRPVHLLCGPRAGRRRPPARAWPGVVELPRPWIEAEPSRSGRRRVPLVDRVRSSGWPTAAVLTSSHQSPLPLACCCGGRASPASPRRQPRPRRLAARRAASRVTPTSTRSSGPARHRGARLPVPGRRPPGRRPRGPRAAADVVARAGARPLRGRAPGASVPAGRWRRHRWREVVARWRRPDGGWSSPGAGRRGLVAGGSGIPPDVIDLGGRLTLRRLGTVLAGADAVGLRQHRARCTWPPRWAHRSWRRSPRRCRWPGGGRGGCPTWCSATRTCRARAAEPHLPARRAGVPGVRDAGRRRRRPRPAGRRRRPPCPHRAGGAVMTAASSSCPSTPARWPRSAAPTPAGRTSTSRAGRPPRRPGLRGDRVHPADAPSCRPGSHGARRRGRPRRRPARRPGPQGRPVAPHAGVRPPLRRRWAARRPDIVHAHFWMSGWAALGAPRRPPAVAGRPDLPRLGVVKRRHQGAADTSPADRAGRGALLREVDHVVATCRDEVDELDGAGRRPDRITVVPCGSTRGLPPDRPGAPAPAGGTGSWSSAGWCPARASTTSSPPSPALPGTELLVAGGPPADRLDADPEAPPPARRRRPPGRRRPGAAARGGGPAGRPGAAALGRRGGVRPLVRAVRHRAARGDGLRGARGRHGRRRPARHRRARATGLLVPPGDPAALAGPRCTGCSTTRRCGADGREAAARVRQHFTWAAGGQLDPRRLRRLLGRATAAGPSTDARAGR